MTTSVGHLRMSHGVPRYRRAARRSDCSAVCTPWIDDESHGCTSEPARAQRVWTLGGTFPDDAQHAVEFASAGDPGRVTQRAGHARDGVTLR